MLSLRYLPIVVYLALAANPLSAAYLNLPQTGQTESYSESDLDDGSIKSGSNWLDDPTKTFDESTKRFINNTDGTITDTITGLMWLKDAGCADTSGFISGANVPNWEQAFQFIGRLNQRAFDAPCLQYTAQYTDWRIPTITELATLLRAGTGTETGSEWLKVWSQYSSGFDNTGYIHGGAWTSTTVADASDKVWVINLLSGNVETANKINENEHYAIFSAVRATSTGNVAPSGQTKSYHPGDDFTIKSYVNLPEPRFIDMENGTVVDRLTGLMWLKNALCVAPNSDWGSVFTSLNSANNADPNFANCNGYSGKFKDWRLPNFKEINSLVNYGRSQPALTQNHPFTLAPTGSQYWTGTSSNVDSVNYAWTIDLDSGKLNAKTAKNSSGMFTLPVRGPIAYADLTTLPLDLNFGIAFIGQEQIAPRVLTITSAGSDDLKLGNLSIDEKNVERLEFTLGHDLCTNKTLKKGESCTVEIRFEPRRSGQRQTTLRIPSNALGLPALDIPIIGTAIDANATGNTICFIATAAYGTPFDAHVVTLRQFRDDVLLKTQHGSQFVKWYYRTSPPIAEWITHREWGKAIVRGVLLPVVGVIHYPVLSLLITLFSISGIVYWLRRPFRAAQRVR